MHSILIKCVLSSVRLWLCPQLIPNVLICVLCLALLGTGFFILLMRLLLFFSWFCLFRLLFVLIPSCPCLWLCYRIPFLVSWVEGFLFICSLPCLLVSATGLLTATCLCTAWVPHAASQLLPLSREAVMWVCVCLTQVLLRSSSFCSLQVERFTC